MSHVHVHLRVSDLVEEETPAASAACCGPSAAPPLARIGKAR